MDESFNIDTAGSWSARVSRNDGSGTRHVGEIVEYMRLWLQLNHPCAEHRTNVSSVIDRSHRPATRIRRRFGAILCPLCMRSFMFEAIVKRRISVEHIIPRAQSATTPTALESHLVKAMQVLDSLEGKCLFRPLIIMTADTRQPTLNCTLTVPTRSPCSKQDQTAYGVSRDRSA